MILRGSDYFTQTATPSPLEHTWSLGIEEQFYLAWPLLLTCLLAGSRTVTARRAAVRSAILLCAAGAGLSAVLLARRYDSDDPGRAYYGTDTRGASLLVGAGLALLLVRRWRRAEERRGPTVGGGRSGRARASRSEASSGQAARSAGETPGCTAVGSSWSPSPLQSWWHTWRWFRAAGPPQRCRWPPWCSWEGSPTASTCGTGRPSSR